MRLHSLRLRAFGPFAAEQLVDFEPLGAGGLFLLDGPTGAGKSTVLDAITFALYGPGEGGGWDRLHSHFAAVGVEPEVSLEFSLRGTRQRVTRSPEYARPKKRGDGRTVEKARVHLQRLEHGRWVSRSSRKDEVGELLADDLGLTRDQFTQVVLLPQGEFMRFLRAGDDERRALLTKLFGTGLYDRITAELDRRRIDAGHDLDRAREAVQRCLGAVTQAARAAASLPSLSSSSLSSLSSSSFGPGEVADVDLDERCDVTARSLAAAVEAAVTDERRAGEDADAARDAAAREAAAAAVAGRYADAVLARARHEATRLDHDRAAVVVEAAARAEPLRPLLDALDEAERTVGESVASMSGMPSVVDVTNDAAAELVHAAARVRRDDAAGLTHLCAREADADRVHALATDAAAAKAKATAAVERLAESARTLPGRLGAARDEAGAARTSAAMLSGLRDRAVSLRLRLRAVDALADLEPRRAAAYDARADALGELEASAARYRDLLAARLEDMAGELADRLRAGEPCVVCGAPEHPNPAPRRPGAVDAAAVSAGEQRRDADQALHEQARARAAELDAERAVLLATAALGRDESRDSLAELLADAGARIDQAADAENALVDLDAAVARLELETDQLSDARRAAESVLATAIATDAAAGAAAGQLDAELTAAVVGYRSVAQRRALLLAEADALDVRAAALTSLAAARSNRDAVLARVNREAADAGFADATNARTALVARAELATLRELSEQWSGVERSLRVAVGAAEFAEVAVEAGDEPARFAEAARARADGAEVAAAQAENAHRAASLARQRAGDAHEAFGAARADLAAARAEFELVKSAAEPVVHLAKLAKGTAGQRKVNLTAYVLRQWFEQVVAAANVRLAGMSSNRYELIRVDEAATRSERAGLTVTVLDRHTGERRSPRSLSGGETFYTSLALALGLADVVRAEAGGIDLDTLFIDEGFGSLDADTLDQVMAVIDELRDRGRTVGIVSHVSELKSRIAERIEVRRLADGSSALRVVA